MKKFLLLTYSLTHLLTVAPATASSSDNGLNQCRPTIFSTSTDWEALSGKRQQEYTVRFGSDKTIGDGKGSEIYYLDRFPCYGQAEGSFAWVAPQKNFTWDNGSSTRFWIVCLVPPKKINIAYRPSSRGEFQGRSEELLECDVEISGREIKVKLNECQRTKWRDINEW